jgi:hypothetical protein
MPEFVGSPNIKMAPLNLADLVNEESLKLRIRTTEHDFIERKSKTDKRRGLKR